ncbi:hypothetical protein CspeluHIS016_0112210 [Cutaneotrichosporon spelunceum]|uniref:C2 domain-containing protein n=1 Tax=Cutaneotrichosporon spelunceum TaxID=1672016 RepID=A0AAD3Y934_9TREE|nr:hypothetical protein CspeluHIS016_0112210 [Cutaneotrichosporon spelunceum]
MTKKEKELEGGRDKTPLKPTWGPTYTLRVVFHSARHLPIGDIGAHSSDPFILAQCETGLPTRHKTDPPLRFRSASARRTLNPKWEAEWIIAGVPPTGCKLKVRVYDEDNGSNDDLLAHTTVQTGRLDEGVKVEGRVYELSRRGTDLRAMAFRTCMKPVSEEARKNVTLTMSFEVLGRTKVELGKAYTANCFWWTHYSPILGRVVNTTTPDSEKEVLSSNFQANQIQLAGPVPNELYHRYISFAAFVPWMFESQGLAGRFLNRAVHQQHEVVYHYDSSTEYGRLPGPGKSMGQRFLDMACWGEGKRIYTYIITLDGLMRFTETGPEFGIDMLSKHTMHSDVNIYIAFSGEFFVRRYRPDAPGEDVAAKYDRNSLDIEIEQEAAKPGKNNPEDMGLEVKRRQRGPDDGSKKSANTNLPHWSPLRQYDVPPQVDTLYGPGSNRRSTEPSDYELVIDNDSGTYRPDKELLPIFRKWLSEQFGGMHVAVMSCSDEINQDMKKKRYKDKVKLKGSRFYRPASHSSSSLSSSDAEAFNEGRHHLSGLEKRFEFVANPKKYTKDEYQHGKDKVKNLKNFKNKKREKREGGEGGTNASAAGAQPVSDDDLFYESSPEFNEKAGSNSAPPANINPNSAQPANTNPTSAQPANANPVNSNADAAVQPTQHDPEKI